MLVVWPGRKGGDCLTRTGDTRGAGFVVETEDRIGIGDIEIGADERHSEWRVESSDEGRSHIGDAVIVRIAQKHDTVSARDRRTGLLHEKLHEKTLDTLSEFGLRRRCGFRDEDIAVGQNMEPARVI